MAATRTTGASGSSIVMEDRLNDIAEILVKQQTINTKLHNEILSLWKELSNAKETIIRLEQQIEALTMEQAALLETIQSLASAAEMETVKEALAEKDEQISTLIDAQVRSDQDMFAFATAAELYAAQAAIAEKDHQIKALVEGQVKTEALIRAWFGSTEVMEDKEPAVELSATEPVATEPAATPKSAEAKAEVEVEATQKLFTAKSLKELLQELPQEPPPPLPNTIGNHQLPDLPPAPMADREQAPIAASPAIPPAQSPDPVAAPITASPAPPSLPESQLAHQIPPWVEREQQTNDKRGKQSRDKKAPEKESTQLPWAERLCRFLGM